MKFGRRPRRHDSRVPHFSALTAKRALAPPPLIVDYAAALPDNLGMFGNDALGDCTCAAVYHALQAWTANAKRHMDFEPDREAVMLYELACGYVPGDPSTDQGGVEQDVLNFWLNIGVPIAHGSRQQSLAAFIEVDTRNLMDVKQALFQGGLVYIGFEVPASFGGDPWDFNPTQDNSIVAGHAVILVGYNDTLQEFTAISWGQKFRMTYRFFSKFVDEAYMLADRDWIECTGSTPAGLTLAELEVSMGELKWNDGHSRWRRRRHRREKRQKGLKPGTPPTQD